MAAPTFATSPAQVSGGNGAGTNVTLTFASAPSTSQLIIAACNVEETQANFSWPALLTQTEDERHGILNQIGVAIGFGNGSTTAFTIGWTGSASRWRNATIFCIDGVDTTTPEDVANSTNEIADPGGTSVTCTGVTTATADTLLVAIGGCRNDRTWTEPSGMTKRTVTIGGAERTVGIATVSQAGAGATGDKAFTLSSSDVQRMGILLALRPVAGAAALRRYSLPTLGVG